MRFLELIQTEQFSETMANENGEMIQFEKMDQSFKTVIMNMFSLKGDFTCMDIFSIWDYLWFYIHKSLVF